MKQLALTRNTWYLKMIRILETSLDQILILLRISYLISFPFLKVFPEHSSL